MKSFQLALQPCGGQTVITILTLIYKRNKKKKEQENNSIHLLFGCKQLITTFLSIFYVTAVLHHCAKRYAIQWYFLFIYFTIYNSMTQSLLIGSQSVTCACVIHGSKEKKNI